VQSKGAGGRGDVSHRAVHEVEPTRAMAVQVDDAGHYEEPAGIDELLTMLGGYVLLADCRDVVSFDAYSAGHYLMFQYDAGVTDDHALPPWSK